MTKTNGHRPEPALEISGLTKEYAGSDVTALDDVSLTVDEGSVVGLLGPNGAGKTTLIKSIVGLIEPSEGTVAVPSSSYADRHSAVGVALEGARNVYWRLTVAENLEFFAGIQGQDLDATRGHRERLIEQFNLEDKRDEPVKNLSRGMKQRVSIAATLARQTPIVFLDEPTLGLDVESTNQLKSRLRGLKDDRTVVISSHDMDVVSSICDRVVIMNQGKIVRDGAVDEMLSLFETTACQLSFDRSLSERERRRLQNVFEVTSPDDDWRQILVTLPDADALYDLVDRCESFGLTIEEIETQRPDLEDIFLEATREVEA